MRNTDIDTRQDLREYSSQELSLWVFNDEGLYRMRRYFLNHPKMLDQYFLYTDDQLDEFLTDVREDLGLDE